MSGRRSQARLYAVLALYQWQLTEQDPAEIGRQFFDDSSWVSEVAQSLGETAHAPTTKAKGKSAYDRELFKQLLYGVPARQKDLDARLRPLLDRPIERVDPVERSILRVGAYELLYSSSVPHGAVINEAVELAKLLGAEQGHRYVNGVLDRLAQSTRGVEMSAGG